MMWGAEKKHEDQMVWFALYGVLYVAFYFFTSPFVGNPELLNSWTPYVYLSMGLYGWLFSAAALHTPVHALGLVDSTIKQPVSLLFPFFSASFVLLIVLELLTALALRRRLGASWSPANVSLARSFMNVLRNSGAISVACVALIVHCDASMEAPRDEDGTAYNRHACEKLFKFSLSDSDTFVPASYRGAILIWFVGMALAMTNFVLERLSGIRVISFHWLTDHKTDEEELETEGESTAHGKDQASPSKRRAPQRLPPSHHLPMVPWYSIFLFDTVVQLLISFKVFLGRFDQRNMQRALLPDDDEYVFDHLKTREHVWLDFMADTGDGFNSTYQIARLLAQPELTVDCDGQDVDSDDDGDDEDDDESASPSSAQASEEDTKEEEEDTKEKEEEEKKKKKKKKKTATTTTTKKKKTPKTRVFPRGEALVIGGDLAYPFPDSETYETRLFRPFEYAMKAPVSYSPATLSTAKRKPGAYDEGLTAFAIPGNHDWFDGLNTFTRLICQRDWLGGWRLPQRSSHFALELPRGWWLFGVDVALEDDVNSEQFAFFERVARTRMRPDDAVILLTHTPRWVLDVYETRQRSEEKLQQLMSTALRGRVALRLAGDVHNYMRHSLANRPGSSAASASAPVTTDAAFVTAGARADRRPSACQSQPPTSPRPVSLSPLSKHFPHMFEGGEALAAAAAAVTLSSPPGAVSSPRSSGAVHSAASISSPRTPAAPPQHLIISGGGGAFLHPTHAPNVDRIVSGGADYVREKCYPPAHISRRVPPRYALLNVFGFRRINWRFDVIGGLGYFALVFSMFPRCSVGEILAMPTWGEVAARFVAELAQLLQDMVSTSYVSLLALVVMLVVLCAFADCDSVPKQVLVGVGVTACHVLAAFTILVVYECVLEVATARGALGGDGPDSLFRHFSSTLPDLSPLRQYDVLRLGELYAALLRVCMTIFDVPEVMALHRSKICAAGLDSLTRTEAWAYYVSVFPYFWVLATPAAGAVFGSYLYVALNAFEAHYNEAFSSLRIASYKHFVRLHVRADGQLELFVLGVDKMPRKWIRDPAWSGSAAGERAQPSHAWTRPSFWKPVVTTVDSMLRLDFENPSLDRKLNLSDRSNVRLVDRVVIPKRAAGS